MMSSATRKRGEVVAHTLGNTTVKNSTNILYVESTSPSWLAVSAEQNMEWYTPLSVVITAKHTIEATFMLKIARLLIIFSKYPDLVLNANGHMPNWSSIHNCILTQGMTSNNTMLGTRNSTEWYCTCGLTPNSFISCNYQRMNILGAFKWF